MFADASSGKNHHKRLFLSQNVKIDSLRNYVAQEHEDELKVKECA